MFAVHGLIEPRRRRRRFIALPTGHREASAPNEVWCIDYKGQFRLGDGSYCYPLTITDKFSRFIVGCEGMAAISDEAAREVCEDIFRTHGVPAVMHSDNGVPFACTGLAGLTRLSAYWLRLGIKLERSRPAHPQDNGRHERMHRTLKAETTRPAREDLLQQQERFDDFVEEFNTQRPHEALDMKRPADVYVPSTKKHPVFLPDPDYSTYDGAPCRHTRAHSFPRSSTGPPLQGFSGAARRHSRRERRLLARVLHDPRPRVRRTSLQQLHPNHPSQPSGCNLNLSPMCPVRNVTYLLGCTIWMSQFPLAALAISRVPSLPIHIWCVSFRRLIRAQGPAWALCAEMAPRAPDRTRRPYPR